MTVNVLEWLDSVISDTPEMRAIDREERALIGLARTLRLAREAAELTQKQLATRLNVSQAQISKWENVNANHTVQSILKYLSGLGVEMGEGSAELILAVRATNGDYLPVTSLAERTVLLSEKVNETLIKRAVRSGKGCCETIEDLLASTHLPAGAYSRRIELQTEEAKTVQPRQYERASLSEYPEAA